MAAHMLWRTRGLESRPAAFALPAPTATEGASLDHCFRLGEAESADCLILLRSAGLSALQTLRASGLAWLKPLIVLDAKLADMADVRFNVKDGDSWSAAAAVITRFAARAKSLKPQIAASDDFDTRLLAYLFVADRALVLRRDGSGQTVLPYTAGFDAVRIIDALKRLAARGLVATKLDSEAPSPQRELVVELSVKGLSFVAAGDGERASA
jgi:hypothetical protein